jgi:acyl carrier protein
MSEPLNSGLDARLRQILATVLPRPLPGNWDPGRRLVEAGLDSVGVVTLVGEIEAAFDMRLTEEDLREENLGTLSGLAALVRTRSGSTS